MTMFKRKDPSQLQAQLASLKGGAGFSNDNKNEWKLKTDTSGNGSAVIRFLPGKGDEGLPFVKLVNHGFKKGGKWYIENCSSTHGDYDSCPVCQHLSKNDSFNTNNEEYKLLKRKTSFWANILVIKDPSAPENEGKVMLFRFGQKIYDKITAMVEVDTSIGEVPQDITCPFEGSNFIMKVKKVGGFQNYDECKFARSTEIENIDSEETQKFLNDNMTDLNALVAKDKFKPFDELSKKFTQIMGTSAGAGAAAASASSALNAQLDDFDKDMQSFESSVKTESTPEVDDSLDDLLADMDI
ncbi:single-stranded DNA binding protein [Serratia phage 4S]|nr:single-stranded DNA binding protein [Serratia phage 4S]